MLRRAAGAPELQLPTSMICNNIETRLCFALQGLGIAYLPDFSIREPLADGRLQPVLADWMEHTNVFHVLWPASRHPRPSCGHWWTSCARGCFRRRRSSPERDASDRRLFRPQGLVLRPGFIPVQPTHPASGTS